MGYIKEPEGIDLVVVPQTKRDPEQDKMVSEYIRKYKLRQKGKLAKKKTV